MTIGTLSAAARPSSLQRRVRGVQRDDRLEAVAAKVERGERLSLDDGLLLYETPDIWTVLQLADRVRRLLHGTSAFYNVNRHLNYSNVCALSYSAATMRRASSLISSTAAMVAVSFL